VFCVATNNNNINFVPGHSVISEAAAVIYKHFQKEKVAIAGVAKVTILLADFFQTCLAPEGFRKG